MENLAEEIAMEVYQQQLKGFPVSDEQAKRLMHKEQQLRVVRKERGMGGKSNSKQTDLFSRSVKNTRSKRYAKHQVNG